MSAYSLRSELERPVCSVIWLSGEFDLFFGQAIGKPDEAQS